jgi:hypothetical protein
MDKSPKTRTELEALVLAELRAAPQCGGASHVTVEDSPKVLSVEHRQMVRTLAPDRADQAFNISVLPRGAE